MLARHVDGFVCATAHRAAARCLPTAAAAGLPVVLMNRYAEGFGLPAVSVDNERGIALAVAPPGRRSAITGSRTSPARRTSRLASAATAASWPRLGPHGLAADPDLVEHPRRPTPWKRADRCCRGACARAGQAAPATRGRATTCLPLAATPRSRPRGLPCPRDISVVGFNDMPFIDRLTAAADLGSSFPHYQVGHRSGTADTRADRRPGTSARCAPCSTWPPSWSSAAPRHHVARPADPLHTIALI